MCYVCIKKDIVKLFLFLQVKQIYNMENNVILDLNFRSNFY